MNPWTLAFKELVHRSFGSAFLALVLKSRKSLEIPSTCILEWGYRELRKLVLESESTSYWLVSCKSGGSTGVRSSREHGEGGGRKRTWSKHLGPRTMKTRLTTRDHPSRSSKAIVGGNARCGSSLAGMSLWYLTIAALRFGASRAFRVAHLSQSCSYFSQPIG
jgi:hypothetical protein